MTYSNILLPVDLADPETQKKAFEVAFHMAQSEGAELHVMTVVPDHHIARGFFPEDFKDKAIEAAGNELKAFVRGEAPGAADGAIDIKVRYGSIHREIIHCAEETACDLIVMATHPPMLRDRVVSPHAVHVITHANQSVLVVRN